MTDYPCAMHHPQLDNATKEMKCPIPFQKSKANLQRSLVLPEGVSIAQYTNAKEHVFYENESVHTFSLYTAGGYETHRTDKPSPNGGPGRYCLMPQGSYSAWEVGYQQHFVHLYFGDNYLKRLAMETFDADPRLVSLPQLSFAENEQLDAIFRHCLINWDWLLPENRLALEQASNTLLVNLLNTIGVKQTTISHKFKSGLSPIAQRLITEYIDHHFPRQIRLSELAEIAGLSEYHFCRMFKISFAESPQQFIMRTRIRFIKQQLDQHRKHASYEESLSLSLAELATQAGFSNQSHMGRVFKKQLGITPGEYLKHR